MDGVIQLLNLVLDFISSLTINLIFSPGQWQLVLGDFTLYFNWLRILLLCTLSMGFILLFYYLMRGLKRNFIYFSIASSLIIYLYLFNIGTASNPFTSTGVSLSTDGPVFSPLCDNSIISENQGALGIYSEVTRELYIAYFQHLLLSTDNAIELLNAALVNKSNYSYLFNYGNTIGERHSSYPVRLNSFSFYNIYIPQRYVEDMCQNEINIYASHFYDGRNYVPTLKGEVLFKFAPELFDSSTAYKWFKSVSRSPVRACKIPNDNLVHEYLSGNSLYLSNFVKFTEYPHDPSNGHEVPRYACRGRGAYHFELVGEAKVYYDSLLKDIAKRGAIKMVNNCFFHDNCIDSSFYFSKEAPKYYSEGAPRHSSVLSTSDQIKLFIRDKRIYRINPDQFCSANHSIKDCSIKPFSGDRFVSFLKHREGALEKDIRTWSNDFIKNGPLSDKLDMSDLHSEYNARLLRNHNANRVISLSKAELAGKNLPPR